ncbi:acetylglutamate kinase [archaeon SCG-AAA382B04]|nr:acetylglutamate kinase [archaeon SCG-AAA382B04]
MKNRANILIEALPYIKNFYGSTIVIKLGGHVVVQEELLEHIVRDVVLLKYVGMKPVIVHGGGPEISRVMEEMGIKPKIVDGLRVTDEKTIEVARMVLIGNVGTKIVSMIGQEGVKAIGLSGKDGKLFTAKKKGTKRITVEGEKREIDLGFVGEIEEINPEMIEIVTEKSLIPVISPIGIDSDGNSLNVNADTVAGEMANKLGAQKLIMMTNVPGVLRDTNDEDSLISQISPQKAQELIKEDIIKDGMIPKVKACIDASKDRVEESHIINAKREHSLLLEIFTDEGVGSMIKKDN